jgi:hypothetical protein
VSEEIFLSWIIAVVLIVGVALFWPDGRGK